MRWEGARGLEYREPRRGWCEMRLKRGTGARQDRASKAMVRVWDALLKPGSNH